MNTECIRQNLAAKPFGSFIVISLFCLSLWFSHAAHGHPIPVCKVINGINVSSLTGDTGRVDYLAITMNGTNTTVIFDGSASINPENVRLYFYWGEVDLGGLPSAHNPRPHPAVLRSVFARSERATNVFVLGDYRLGLAVLEFSLRFHEVPRAGIEFWLTVATPGEVIDLLSASLAIAASPDVPRKSLVHLLAKAQEALEEGKARKAGHHLKDLLKESRRHPISSNPQAAETFRAVVDELIHALKAARADSRQIEADDHDD